MTTSGILSNFPQRVITVLTWPACRTWFWEEKKHQRGKMGAEACLSVCSRVLTGTSWLWYHWCSIVQLEMKVSEIWLASSCWMTSRPHAPVRVVTSILSPAHLKSYFSCFVMAVHLSALTPPHHSKVVLERHQAPLLPFESLTSHDFTCFYLFCFHFSQTLFHAQLNWQ